MAYRRKLGVTKASSTFKEEIYHQPNPSEDDDENSNNNNNSVDHNQIIGDENVKIKKENNDVLAARATRASAVHRDSSAYGYAYATPAAAAADRRQSDHLQSASFPKGTNYESTSIADSNDPKYGFWGILARKAKSILDEDNQFESSTKAKSQVNDTSTADHQIYQSRQSSESGTKLDNARLRKRLDAITSSLNNFGDTLGNAFEEGRTIMEHKTADIIQETRSRTADFIQETRKLQLRRRGGNSDTPDQATVVQNTSWQRPVAQPVQTSSIDNRETQLKASRDVAMATAAKAKVLLRELKTVKADLAFAKERCAQLEEENKRLRENREKGDNPDDEDLIRLQLETLLAEKARLAHENSIYARENRFLREIVEYHQLTMQDVVYLDEGAEEVTEVYPFSIDESKELSSTPSSPTCASFLPEDSSPGLPTEKKEHASEVPNTSPFLFPSPPPTICPTINSADTTESSEVPVSSQLMTNEKTEDSCYRELPIAADEAPKRPPVLSP